MEQTLPPTVSPPPARGFAWRARLRAGGIPTPAAERQEHVRAGGRSAEYLEYAPPPARRSDRVALIDAASGEVVGHAPFDGF